MVFASTLNKKYIHGARVTLNSLKRFIGTDIEYHIFLFDNTTPDDCSTLKIIYPNIVFHTIVDPVYQKYSLNNPFRAWDYNVFNRLEIFTLKTDKIIFLDFDLLICNEDVATLVAQKVDFGACLRLADDLPDYTTPNPFDAGVMVIGEKFISPDVKHQILELSKLRDWSSEEPVLNQFFSDHLTILPQRYNVLTSCYGRDKHFACIIQYVGVLKPWQGHLMFDRFDGYILKLQTASDLVTLNRLYREEMKLVQDELDRSNS